MAKKPKLPSFADLRGEDVTPERVPIVMKGDHAEIPGEYLKDNGSLASFSVRIEGRRAYTKEGAYRFEATQHNLDTFRAIYGGPPLQAPKRKAEAILAPTPSAEPAKRPKDYKFKTEPYDLQLRAFLAARGKRHFAFYMEMGTGKTKVTIDKASDDYLAGDIKQVLILAPKGVHAQWTYSDSDVTSQVDIHCPVPNTCETWPFKALPRPTPTKLQFVSFNVDALLGDAAYDLMLQYCQRAPTLIIFDESHKFKNAAAKRSKMAAKLVKYAWGVLLLTGTPVAKNLVDLWSQFKLLDERIIGHRYITTFRSTYCIMGGFEGRQVVGHKNLDDLLVKINPYIFRAKKSELGLPPKIFAERVFDLSNTQKKHYTNLKKEFITAFKDGTPVTVPNAAVMILRLQQIACGYLAHEDKLEEIEDARLPALLEIIEQRSGKMIIWCRFQRDVERICERLGGYAVPYYGPNTDQENAWSKQQFISGDAQFFVGTPAKGGTGVDGLQKVARTVVYYSNSFSSIERWQSEDRTNRIGMVHDDCLYLDLIARGTVDRRLINVLKRDATLRDAVMDVTAKLSVREMMEIIEG